MRALENFKQQMSDALSLDGNDVHFVLIEFECQPKNTNLQVIRAEHKISIHTKFI